MTRTSTWPEAYGAAIRQQAALSEQMQSARALLLDRPKASNMRLRLAAMIGILLDCFDSLIAAHTELEQLRNAPAAATLRARIAITLRAGALDLQHLSLDLLTTQTPHLPPDHSLAVDSLRREAARLAEHGELSAEESRAVAQTTERIAAALGHVRRLEQALGDDEVARAAIADIDLGAFAARPSYDPRLLLVHLTPNSPVLRFAVRLALAMSAGALATASLSSVSHGNWVLLTIAVILRPGYGLTAQRRDDRVIGTLIGCVLAALIVALAPIWLLVVVQGLALAVTHGFVRLRYRVASVGASMVALVSLHLINPGEAAPILTRLADTMLGAAFAQAFSLVLPRWEFNEAPRLAQSPSGAIADFAKVALSPSAGDQEYRLARKEHDRGDRRLVGFGGADGRRAAVRASRPRRDDDDADRRYRLCAHLSAARLDLRGAEKGGAAIASSEAEATRQWLAERLAADPATASDPPPQENAPLPRLRAAAMRLIDAARAFEQASAHEGPD